MKKHALSTRLWHWLNLICLVVLFMSGLNISNAHRFLYWGDYGFDPADAWLVVPRFPGWATIPDYYSLAKARDWHILMAWPFALGLLFMWIAMLANRHFKRDIMTSRREWKPVAVWHDVVQHLKLNFEHEGTKYNFLQKLAYGVVLGVFLPMMILTGLAISPGFEPAAPWLVDLLGGRQSARSLHFIFAWAIFAFFVVHIALVLLTGPFRQIRDMITGGTT
ncbi:cytochrome b/b6 domain-containing protein [Altererythrobacter arenosus]|uniref:Cytochrome b/b6 domain-containing protein n=1 Tax=Altererythrobacter arenosus TaxID=3032592 RepID=A0ABY8FR55_9SPHN|nr:cytochrome b/b6 domain-containing protein [Altererythrobacter sp. CAU 1644]WFL76720.1 cytochrome b/b6 domain-containing protein [Altererythrobacter sp. CAU 1644]